MTSIDSPPDFTAETYEANPFHDPHTEDSWLPIDLTTLPDTPPIQPTLGASNGIGLVYPGKRHVFSGPPESAKTLAAYATIIQVIRDGGIAILLDFEMGGYDSRDRLYDLGATPAELRQGLRYLEPNDPATEHRISRLIDLNPDLVVIDAAAGAYDLQGLDDNKRQDVEQVARLYTNAFWRAGIATIFIDHVVKNTETRGKFMIGSERKLGGADVHIGFETITPISRGTKGLYKITTHKDRGGYLKRGHFANLDLASDPETNVITWTFKPVENETTDTGTFRPTHLMEKVSAWLATQPEPVSRQTIKDAKLGKAEYVTAAIDALILEDYAHQTEGLRGAKLVAGTRLFHDDTPPIPDPFPPIPGTGERTHSHPFPPLQGEPGDLRGARNGKNSRPIPDDPNDDIRFP